MKCPTSRASIFTPVGGITTIPRAISYGPDIKLYGTTIGGFLNARPWIIVELGGWCGGVGKCNLFRRDEIQIWEAFFDWTGQPISSTLVPGGFNLARGYIWGIKNCPRCDKSGGWRVARRVVSHRCENVAAPSNGSPLCQPSAGGRPGRPFGTRNMCVLGKKSNKNPPRSNLWQSEYAEKRVCFRERMWRRDLFLDSISVRS